MKYGLIGEKLPHSFSREIHRHLADYTYELFELSPCELDSFMRRRDFAAINVTIPYKQAVIPYLDEIDPVAREIGAVNTIVNRDGKLFGSNTDFFGMKSLISHSGVDLSGADVLILGTGGTSRTAHALATSLGARRVTKVGRRATADSVTYETAYESYADADVIINTTPCGMFPNENGSDTIPASPVDLDRFTSLKGVIDAVYNPLRTNLVLDARERGITAEGGLYMLVAQAVRASEHFTGESIPASVCDRVYGEVLRSKENIVLTGMAGCGKSTVGRGCAKLLGREFVDTDEVITSRAGRTIPEIFADVGEAGFRDLETEAVRLVTSAKTGVVIATGGGAVLRRENVRMLKRSGRLYFIDRPIGEILPTSDRPLSSDREALERRFAERYETYVSTSDAHVRTDGVIEHTCQKIIDHFTSSK